MSLFEGKRGTKTLLCIMEPSKYFSLFEENKELISKGQVPRGRTSLMNLYERNYGFRF